MKFFLKNFFCIFILLNIISCSSIHSQKKYEKIFLKKESYKELPGWNQGNQINFLILLKRNCNRILYYPYYKNIGTKNIIIYPYDYYKVCQELSKTYIKSSNDMRYFIQNNFEPYLVFGKQETNNNYFISNVQFTGYFYPIIYGSFIKTNIYKYPLYKKPNDLIFKKNGNIKIIGLINNNGDFVSYYTRAQISSEKYQKNHKVLLWLKDPTDIMLLQSQRSGIIYLPNGKKVFIAYDADNGWPYYSIANWFLIYGHYSKDIISWIFIRNWVHNNLNNYKYVFNTNPHYVFFKIIKKYNINYQKDLIPFRIINIDSLYIPINTLIWINTKWPIMNNSNDSFNRLMISKNSFGGIIGPLRGDIYLGKGNIAFSLSKYINYPGKMYLLLPKKTADRLK